MEMSEYLSRLPFASCASEEDMRLVSQYAYIAAFSKGEVIYTRSQAEELGLALVIAGSLCASMISDEGKQFFLYRVSPGESSVFTARCVLNLLSSDAMVEAEAAGSMLVIPPTALEKVLQNPLAESALKDLTLKRCALVMGVMERLLFTRVDKRLAAYLLQAAGKDGWEVRMTHEQLARDISSAREVVSRTLARFAKEGLISLRRGLIRIEKPDGLRKLI